MSFAYFDYWPEEFPSVYQYGRNRRRIEIYPYALRLEDIELEEKQCHRRLEELKSARAQIKHEIARKHNSRLPIFDLPRELLANILELAFFSTPRPDDHTRLLNRLNNTHDNPIELILAAVCHEFRDLATTVCSGLWTSIRVKPSTDLSELDTYLERSKSRLIDVNIELEDRKPSKLRYLPRFNLIHHNSRIRSLHIEQYPTLSIGKNLLVDGFVKGLRDLEFNSLEVFEITIGDGKRSWTDEYEASSSIQFINVGTTPRLKYLRLHAIGFPAFLPDCTTVERLSLENTYGEFYFDLSKLIRILPTFSSLTSLRIDNPFSERLSNDILPLPSVQTFCLKIEDESDVSCILNRIEAPALTNLVLSQVEEWDMRQWLEEHGFTDPQFLTLHTFVLNNCAELKTDTLTALGKRLPSVSRLCLRGDGAKEITRNFGRLPPNIFCKVNTLVYLSGFNYDIPILAIGNMLTLRTDAQCHIPGICMPNSPPTFGKWLFRRFTSVEYLSPRSEYPEQWMDILDGEDLNIVLDLVFTYFPKGNLWLIIKFFRWHGRQNTVASLIKHNLVRHMAGAEVIRHSFEHPPNSQSPAKTAPHKAYIR